MEIKTKVFRLVFLSLLMLGTVANCFAYSCPLVSNLPAVVKQNQTIGPWKVTFSGGLKVPAFFMTTKDAFGVTCYYGHLFKRQRLTLHQDGLFFVDPHGKWRISAADSSTSVCNNTNQLNCSFFPAEK